MGLIIQNEDRDTISVFENTTGEIVIHIEYLESNGALFEFDDIDDVKVFRRCISKAINNYNKENNK